MGKTGFTTIYLSIPKEDDTFIDIYRVNKIKEERKNITKNDIVAQILSLGLDVINGKYFKLNSNLEPLISQFQELNVVIKGNKTIIKKSKGDTCEMLILKGIEKLDEDSDRLKDE